MPYQRAPSPPMTAPLATECARAVHVITHAGGLLRAGHASLHVLDQIGWHRTARLLSHWPLIVLVETGYAIVARNRQFFSRLFFR
jgi:predicted DCC family thiol-disulfide oxidoreductase YuxK